MPSLLGTWTLKVKTPMARDLFGKPHGPITETTCFLHSLPSRSVDDHPLDGPTQTLYPSFGPLLLEPPQRMLLSIVISYKHTQQELKIVFKSCLDAIMHLRVSKSPQTVGLLIQGRPQQLKEQLFGYLDPWDPVQPLPRRRKQSARIAGP